MLMALSRKYAPRQTTYVRLLRPGDQFTEPGDTTRTIYTVAEKPIQDEESGTVRVLLVGRPRPYVYEYNDRVRLR